MQRNKISVVEKLNSIVTGVGTRNYSLAYSQYNNECLMHKFTCSKVVIFEEK